MRLPTLLSPFVTLFVTLAASAAWAQEAASPTNPAPVKPNIVVILVDDMGFSDIGCYGSEIPTPHLDALAKNGLRFTQFYNTGRCCPTRAALLTGVYPHQAGVGHMTENRGVPGYEGRLNAQCATIAEALQPAGYFTAMTGKWHVGLKDGAAPWDRGFDRSLNAAAGGFYQPDSPRALLFLNSEKIDSKDARLPNNWYSTDLWTSFGLKFIDEAREAHQPFFLYLAHNAPHFPLQAPDGEIAKFRGKYKTGWDQLRRQRHARQIEMGIVEKSWPITPRPDAIQAWENLTEARKDHFDHLMAVYAATVSRMDRAVGDLVAGLKQRGVLDNTLILFMSDNGGNAESGPDGRSQGNPTEAGSTWFSGESWAFLQNTPFRRYKHFNHEGGIATPLIAHWPQGIPAKNELRRQPAHVIDIMATCLAAAGTPAPTGRQGKPVLPPEGRSLLPAFAGQPLSRDALFWEHEGNAAVRAGDWKLVRQGREGAWELYDLAKDRTEQTDLAAIQPDQVKTLAAQWEAWAVRANVKPYPKAGAGKANRARRNKANAPTPQ